MLVKNNVFEALLKRLAQQKLEVNSKNTSTEKERTGHPRTTKRSVVHQAAHCGSPSRLYLCDVFDVSWIRYIAKSSDPVLAGDIAIMGQGELLVGRIFVAVPQLIRQILALRKFCKLTAKDNRTAV